MTKPRRHIAGQVALLTRRCSERRYFLRPDDYINQVIPFEVGKWAEERGQDIYAAMAMSNHMHFVNGDTTGDRSDFMRDTMSGIARARNRDLKREKGHFWESGEYGDTVLLDKDAIERKLLYVWLNPVRAGLVERAADWPGFKILPSDWGKTIQIDQPDKFYGRRSPESAEFTPQPPPEYDDMSLEEVKAHFERLLHKEENKILARRKRAQMGIVGVSAVKALDPMTAPSTEDSTSRINPRFATTDAALMAGAKSSYRAFCDRYETRRQRWLTGKSKKVVFPCGTVQLKRQAPITCKEVASDEPGLFAVCS